MNKQDITIKNQRVVIILMACALISSVAWGFYGAYLIDLQGEIIQVQDDLITQSADLLKTFCETNNVLMDIADPENEIARVDCSLLQQI